MQPLPPPARAGPVAFPARPSRGVGRRHRALLRGRPVLPILGRSPCLSGYNGLSFVLPGFSLARYLALWNNADMIIGDRLRALREDKKFSQGDIEKRTGLLRCYISRVENGHTVPAIETLEKMARALEIPLYQ